ncbi:MAG: hypothetical protein V1701_05160 [Planctomycetota bacterium]
MAYKRRYFSDGQVSTPQITEGAITEDKLASDAVTSPKIKDATIQTEDIADKAVTLAKLGDDVPAVGIPDNSISAAKLADNSVEKRHIKSEAVDTAEIAGGAVTAEKIRDGAVTPAKLSFVPGGITRPITPGVASDELQDDSVVEDKIKDNAVTEEKLAGNAVSAGKIAGGAVGPSKIDAVNTPADGQVLSYETATSRFKYITPSGGGGSKLTLFQSHFICLWEQSNTNIDQLIDLASFIPATATAVIVEIQFNAMSVPIGLEQQLWVYGRRGGADWGNSTIHFIWQNTAGVNNEVYKEAVVATDSARQIRVIATKNGQFCSTNIWLRGYVE